MTVSPFSSEPVPPMMTSLLRTWEASTPFASMITGAGVIVTGGGWIVVCVVVYVLLVVVTVKPWMSTRTYGSNRSHHHHAYPNEIELKLTVALVPKIAWSRAVIGSLVCV